MKMKAIVKNKKRKMIMLKVMLTHFLLWLIRSHLQFQGQILIKQTPRKKKKKIKQKLQKKNQFNQKNKKIKKIKPKFLIKCNRLSTKLLIILTRITMNKNLKTKQTKQTKIKKILMKRIKKKK